MKYILVFLCCLIEIVSLGQKKMTPVSKVSTATDTVTSINPDSLSFKNFSYKRMEIGAVYKRPLKLGIKSGKLYVIDSSGKVQPYKIISFDLSTIFIGGVARRSCAGNSINYDEINKGKIGSKFCFEKVVVSDSNKKTQEDVVESLCVEQIKRVK